MDVRWTRRALRRLREHTRYIAQWAPDAAYEMAQRVRHSVSGLAGNPLMGRQGRYLGTRELVVEKGRYVIVYRVRGQSIQIISMHDTRQPWPQDLENA